MVQMADAAQAVILAVGAHIQQRQSTRLCFSTTRRSWSSKTMMTSYWFVGGTTYRAGGGVSGRGLQTLCRGDPLAEAAERLLSTTPGTHPGVIGSAARASLYLFHILSAYIRNSLIAPRQWPCYTPTTDKRGGRERMRKGEIHADNHFTDHDHDHRWYHHAH